MYEGDASLDALIMSTSAGSNEGSNETYSPEISFNSRGFQGMGEQGELNGSHQQQFSLHQQAMAGNEGILNFSL